METVSTQDRMAQSIERTNQEYHEKFKRETLELICKNREEKKAQGQSNR
jgi:hypothetical protein